MSNKKKDFADGIRKLAKDTDRTSSKILGPSTHSNDVETRLAKSANVGEIEKTTREKQIQEDKAYEQTQAELKLAKEGAQAIEKLAAEYDANKDEEKIEFQIPSIKKS